MKTFKVKFSGEVNIPAEDENEADDVAQAMVKEDVKGKLKFDCVEEAPPS